MKGKKGIMRTDFLLYELQLTDHAYERYLERVGPIDRKDLEVWCRSQFSKGTFWYTTTDRLIELEGVWWNFEINSESQVILTTCYGRGSYDMARALRWEHKQRDIVILKQLL